MSNKENNQFKESIKCKETDKVITRSEALKKIGNYGKYAVLTALGTYILLNPMKSQAASLPPDPGTGF